jgi:hypothetical protein
LTAGAVAALAVFGAAPASAHASNTLDFIDISTFATVEPTPVDIAAVPTESREIPFGSSFTHTLLVTNASDTAVHGVALIFFDAPAFLAETKFTNCTYIGDLPRACRFDQVLNPHTTYEIEIPYVLSQDTLAPALHAAYVEWTTIADFDRTLSGITSLDSDPGVPGDSGLLELTDSNGLAAPSADTDGPLETDVRRGNNLTFLGVIATGDNGIDLAAVGATLTGAVGDLVIADVGIKNNGPAALEGNRIGTTVRLVHVVVPLGTTAVTVPQACAPEELNNGPIDFQHRGEAGHVLYACMQEQTFFGAGTTRTFQLTLRIDQLIPDQSGSVSILHPCLCDEIPLTDSDPSNNVAKIFINPAPTTGDGTTGDGLAATGTRVGPIVGIGGVLVALGVAAVALARRRRLRS